MQTDNESISTSKKPLSRSITMAYRQGDTICQLRTAES